MSWNIKIIGPRDAVKARVLADTNVPPSVKQVIVEVCDDISENSTRWIRLDTHGHFSGTGHSSVGRLQIAETHVAEGFELIELPEEPKAEPPQAAPAQPVDPAAGVAVDSQVDTEAAPAPAPVATG